jgi:hypothetical protein
VGGAERVAQACSWWRVGIGGIGRCWAAGAERAHGHEQAMLEYDVPSNGTRRRSCGGGLLHEMRERDGIDPNYATVNSGGARVVVSRTRARSRVRCTRGSKLEGEEANRR